MNPRLDYCHRQQPPISTVTSPFSLRFLVIGYHALLWPSKSTSLFPFLSTRSRFAFLFRKFCHVRILFLFVSDQMLESMIYVQKLLVIEKRYAISHHFHMIISFLNKRIIDDISSVCVFQSIVIYIQVQPNILKGCLTHNMMRLSSDNSCTGQKFNIGFQSIQPQIHVEIISDFYVLIFKTF